MRTRIVALLAPAAVAILCACERAEEPQPVSAPPVPPRLLLIGLDGATWDQLDPLIAEGRLPNLARLKQRSAIAPLQSMLPSSSPALWTTIATGKNPEKHGITGFFASDPLRGGNTPIDATMRRARTFWEILGDGGLSSCIVYWWNTWPASPVEGVLVSDYLFYARNALQYARPVEQARLLERAAWPPDLVPFLVQELDAARRLPPDLVRSIAPFDDDELRRFLEDVDPRLGEARSGEALSVLKNKLIESEFHRRVGLSLLDRRGFDVHVYYSKGIDASGHMFWRFFEPDAEAYAGDRPAAAEISRFAPVIPGFYEYEDRTVGELLERAGPSTYVLVVSDHGHHAGGHTDGPPGIFLLSGPGVRPGPVGPSVSIRDVTPLILWLFDVPVGEDFDGSVPIAAFRPEHAAAHPVRTVPTHEDGRTIEPAAMSEEVRSSLEEELRALGYVD